MKKILLFIALSLSMFVFAQNHPGKRMDLLLGKEVTIEPLHPRSDLYRFGYDRFYSDDKFSTVYMRIDRGYGTKQTAFDGRSFKVIKVEKIYYSFSTAAHYNITLEDTATKELIYHQTADDQMRHGYYFIVKGGLDYPADFYCDFIVDKVAATGYKSYSTTKKHYGDMVDKTINLKTGAAEYQLNLATVLPPNKKPVGKAGVIIYLDNNKKIMLPKEMVAIGEQLQAFIILTKPQVELLRHNRITGYSLLGVDAFILPEDMEIMRGTLDCMVDKK